MRTPIVTLSDVASAAGVDASTVSRVLNGNTSQRVSADTRDRIFKSAEALGYRPNLLARGLRTSRTNTLGIVVPLLDSPVFTQMILGAERAAQELGFSLLISHVREHGVNEETYERLAHSNHVDGLLVATLDPASVMVKAVMRARIPFVLLNREVPGKVNCVYFDLALATRMAMNHLFELGHTRIAHLTAEPNNSFGPRLATYQDCLFKAGIPFDPSLVAISGFDVDGGAAGMREILKRPGPRPTAVFPLTLAAAVGALSELHRSGIRVPEEMSVVTIHDGYMAAVVTPALTTVRFPVLDMGARGAQMLAQLIDGQSARSDVMLSPEGLVMRGSTAPPQVERPRTKK